MTRLLLVQRLTPTCTCLTVRVCLACSRVLAFRGPFLPVYASRVLHWAMPFLSRLTNKVCAREDGREGQWGQEDRTRGSRRRSRCKRPCPACGTSHSYPELVVRVPGREWEEGQKKKQLCRSKHAESEERRQSGYPTAQIEGKAKRNIPGKLFALKAARSRQLHNLADLPLALPRRANHSGDHGKRAEG